MADRFPLIVNAVSKKIEEIASGDRLDFTGNGIVISGDAGDGKYLSSNGSEVFWGTPGNVYLTQTQTLTNKTFETCVISGSNNTLTNIPNSALINSGITVNGVTIALGGSVTTPDNNTTYSISAQDGSAATEKVIRLTSGGNFGAGINDDIKIAVGSPSSVPSGSNALSLFLDRTNDTISISGHVVDNNTITTISAPGGSAQSGAISFTSTGAASVSMTGSTVNIDAIDTDTKTKIRVGAGGSYAPADNSTGNFTFLASGASTVSQAANGTTGDPEITVSSTDTVTRVRGGTTGTFTPSTTGTSTTDVTFAGGNSGNVTVSQSGNTILIDSVDTNTVTKFAANTETLAAGDFRLKATGDAALSTATVSGVKEITIGFTNTDTGATFAARGGVQKTGIWFQLKNYNNFTGNRVLKWDSGNEQLANSIIQDDGSSVTIDGDLIVQGNQTILNTSTLQVEDNTIELRKGNNLVGFNGGIQVNRTTDSGGNVTAYQTLQWYESGSYWRSWDGSVEKRFVTESETQVLSNKTLTSPTLTAPVLGAATATSINGLAITSTASATLTVATSKTLSVSRSLTLTTDSGTTSTNVNFRLGGDVVYKSDTLASLSSTTSTQLRGLITDTTGLDRLVFQTSPNILTSITTTSTGFALINSGAQSIQFGGAATLIDIGAAGGTTNINQNLVVDEDLTVGTGLSDNLICNATFDSRNADILIRGGSTDPMVVGRGGGAVNSNTALGTSVLQANNSGSQNTAVGYQTLLTNNSGAGNTAYGHQALRSVNVGDGNTAVGRGSLLSNQSGDYNVAIGANSMETPTAGNANVCIGYYSGYNCNGSGNVLIGPADSANPVNDVTYSPLNQSGDRQLVIGSGTEFWIRGDNSFNLTLNNNATVNNNLTVKGNLIVNGTTTTVKSTVVEIADKAINLGAVVTANFTCTTVNGSATITDINPTLGLIPGMGIQSGQGYVPGGTVIVSITGNTAVLSNPVSISGTPTFTAIGPSDTSANDGGIIVNGSTNKSFLWKDLTDAWTSSEHMDLATGKEYRIDNVLIASGSQIGPSTGVFTLGGAVTTSSLTSVGTLTSLTVSGNVDIDGTGYLKLPGGTDAQRPGETNQPTAEAGQLRWNTTNATFEGYDGNQWGAIGGGVSISSGAPIGAAVGDLWYDEDDGRLFVYYNDGTTSQWVDASPNGTPTDLVVEGTTTLRGTATTRAILPDADATYNLGGPSNRWANIYSADLQLSNEGSANEVDGTWGQYTIQEGEEDLFLINRRNGKKYKFMLQEVN